MTQETLQAIREYRAVWKKWVPTAGKPSSSSGLKKVKRAEDKMLELIRKEAQQ